MSEESLSRITDTLEKIMRGYAERFGFETSDDWFLLKLQEEMGELTAAHLKVSGRARVGDKSPEALEQNLRDEIGDVLALALLYARRRGIDPETAIREKWLKYL